MTQKHRSAIIQSDFLWGALFMSGHNKWSSIKHKKDLDDVQNVYANYDISDAEMDRISGLN